MMHYLIQTIAFQVFFLLVYDVFLRKETFFNWNRVYLLGTAFLSFILPLIKIDVFKEVVPQEYIIQLPAIILGQIETNNETGVLSLTLKGNNFSIWEVTFYLGLLLATCLFLYKLITVIYLIKGSQKSYFEKLVLVKLSGSKASFSFFRYVFLGELLKDEERKTILLHENIHAKQLHSLDLLFFEVLRVFFWFNPLVYIYQKRIATLHEFIADAEAVKGEGKSNYYQSLLAQVFETKHISFINPFFKQSLIKKRIVMLQKSKSKQINLLKYGLIFPVVLGILMYTSGIEQSYANNRVFVSELNEAQESLIISKVKEIKYQIEKQGNVNAFEEQGLNLLLHVISSNKVKPNLINTYVSQSSQTKLTEKISDILIEIQKVGSITDAEERALKKLLIFTSENGFENSFFADIIKDVDVPFSVVDDVPVYPGCKASSRNETKRCFSQNVSQFVNRNFNTKIADSVKLEGRQRINVIFKISHEGNIVGVRARAPHPLLKAEAIRVIKGLPKMTPGKQKGKNINVPYSLPIIFEVKK